MPVHVASLHWLSGQWRRDSPESVAEELWLEPLGGCMLGVDREVRAGGKVTFEHLRIQEENGTLVLHASMQGRPAIAFTLTHAGESEATFERDADSFPTRIRYRREQRVLHCRIDGGGREMEWSWPLVGFSDSAH